MALSKEQRERFQWIVDQTAAELAARGENINYLNLYDDLEKLSKLDYKLNYYNLLKCERALRADELKKEEKTEQKALELMNKYNLHNAHIQTDPRGGAVRYELPITNRFNTWGGDIQFNI